MTGAFLIERKSPAPATFKKRESARGRCASVMPFGTVARVNCNSTGEKNREVKQLSCRHFAHAPVASLWSGKTSGYFSVLRASAGTVCFRKAFWHRHGRINSTRAEPPATSVHAGVLLLGGSVFGRATQVRHGNQSSHCMALRSRT